MSKHGVDVYENRVAVRYQLYNALFTTLPFEDLKDWAPLLAAFRIEAKTRLDQGESPVEIVEDLLSKYQGEERIKLLFHFLQQVERQITLFDAVEDSAVEQTHDLRGSGTLDYLIARCKEKNLIDELLGLLHTYRVRIVLTAHPTQFYPDPVLQILRDLGEALKSNDVQEIRLLLLQLSKTQFRNRNKPTPLQEARSLLWYVENNFYPEMASMQKRLNELLPDQSLDLPPLIEIGFWPGGDRDGNPFVTSSVTRAVAHELHESILRLYIRDLELVLRRLTFAGVYEPLVAVLQKLRTTYKKEQGQEYYTTAQQLQHDLENVMEVLDKHYDGLFAEILEDLLIKVRLFGFHFSTIDIRQDSRIHEQCMLELMPVLGQFGFLSPEKAAAYPEMTEKEQLEVLLELMQKDAPEDLAYAEGLSDLCRETLLSYMVAKDIQQENGLEALHRSIISNNQSALDCFEVLALIHLSGWNWHKVPIDVVPLFETIEDLGNSLEIMEFLYTHPIWVEHLQRRNYVQNIMLGFSDGTKDGGYLGANWGIYKAKRALTELSRKYGVQVIFFDGRGGPPARGGGNTHRFYRSLGKDVEHHQIQLTIQGQTISSNFGTPEMCRYNLEQLFTAGLESFLFYAEEGSLPEVDKAFLEELGRIAREKYLEFKSDELFVPYLEEMTPLRYYDRLNVGSRPAKRKGDSKLKFEDLRAIPFVSSWSQVKQNIPGFYGLGTALQSIRNNAVLWAKAKELYKGNLFFATLIENAMQSLSKTSFPLTSYIRHDPTYGAFWQGMFDEAVLTEKLLLEVSGMNVLLEKEPATRRSIELREQIVLPLLVIQQYALDRVRMAEIGELEMDEEVVETLRKLVVKSLATNINASRNSA